MKIEWVIFTDAKNIKNSEVVLGKVFKKLDAEPVNSHVEPYHKGGHRCSFDTELNANNWADAVFLTIYSSQLIGRGWEISGSIDEEVNMWSNDSNISGVTNIQVQCFNHA